MKKKTYYRYKMNMLELNIVSFLILGLMLGITYLMVRLEILENLEISLGLIIILYIPYMFLHEFFHSLAYVLHGANFKNITYGIHIEKGILCCLCKQNISKKAILISLLYPLIFLGILTYLISIGLNNWTLIWLSIMNISGCAGDIIMFLELVKLKNFEFSEYDDPTAFAIYTEENLESHKMFGLEFSGKTDKLEIQDKKKISTNRLSILFLFFLFLIGILHLFIRK